jgi:DNA-binding LacI/PurR family transcriptional regulator
MGKPVTIMDIAREAGVSPSLVSFVFNGKNRVGAQTRERILAVAERLGYRKPETHEAQVEWPAARLIGVIVPEMEAHAPWMERLSHSAFRLGYTLQFAPTLKDPVKFCHLVRAFSGTQGLVILEPPRGDSDCENALRVCPVPYVIPEGEKPDQTIKKLIEKI